MAVAQAMDDPQKGAHLPSQAIADLLRKAGEADFAFVPAGVVRNVNPNGSLAEVLEYPTDQVCVVELKGSQIKLALERSVTLFPMGNGAFLQLSGMTVTFKPTAPVDHRVVSVRLQNGGTLEDARSYTVAMPATLARGGLGYFKVWDKTQIVKTLDGATLESVVKGQPMIVTDPRWIAQN